MYVRTHTIVKKILKVQFVTILIFQTWLHLFLPDVDDGDDDTDDDDGGGEEEEEEEEDRSSHRYFH